jgi:hypothetical protein
MPCLGRVLASQLGAELGVSHRITILLTHCPFFQARKSRLVAQAVSAYRLLAYTRRAIISSIVAM